MSSDLVPIHDLDSCPICGPIVRSEAFQRGAEAARATLPITVVEVQVLDNHEP